MATKNILLALDLALSLGSRLTAVMNAIQAAAAAGRDDLTTAELEAFADADDAARERLADKIVRTRIQESP